MSARIIVDLIEEGSKYIQLSPDKADPIQLALRTQIANNDRYPQFVKHLMRLRNIANSCRSKKLTKVMMRFVMAYWYSMVSQSSVNGRLIKILHSKKEEISLLNKDLKNVGIRERIMENKADQMAREEQQDYN